MDYMIRPVGKIHITNNEMTLKLFDEFIPCLKNLDGFSHLQIFWWFDKLDNKVSRGKRVLDSPYVNGPDSLGIFATRSPERPNPIALSTSYITYIDYQTGTVGLAYIDAMDGSPVIDLKPYTPSIDRVSSPEVPSWCSHWPKSIEESGNFDWEKEFNF